MFDDTAYAESVETDEVAVSPVDEDNELSENIPDTANPDSEDEEEELVEEEPTGRSESDAAFARMRRESEQYQEELNAARAELEELRAQAEAREEAFNRLTGSEDGEIAALAEVTGMSEDEIRAEMEAAAESAQKDLRIDQLEQKLQNIEVQNMMQRDLTNIQKIDPSIKSLEDLGPQFVNYVAAGLPPEDAYWAIKAKEGANRRTPPKAMGKVATTKPEKDYYTEAEIDAMSSDQLKANWKKVFGSWGR